MEKIVRIGSRVFPLGERTYVMGILNITPDSFSDSGKHNRLDEAVEHALRMVKDGADIIDVGGESTRPNYSMILDEEEIARVIPVIEAIRKKTDIPISVDTYKSKVADAACQVGADMINDIWGMRFDADMARVVAKNSASVCIMHNRSAIDYKHFYKDLCDDLDGDKGTGLLTHISLECQQPRPLVTEITGSSSAMDLSVLFDDVVEPDGSWDDNIYLEELGVIGDSPIPINNTSKVVENKNYAIKLPSSILLGTHKLTFKGVNAHGNSATTNVWIKYTNPPVVEIIEPISESNTISKYIYIDIDYSDIIDDEGYMNQAGWMEIIFSITESLTDVHLKLESGGLSVPTDEYNICIYDGTSNRDALDLSLAHSGNQEYVLQLKMSSMSNLNVREFRIIAEDMYVQEGSDSFTLLRRSLFPLD